MPHLSYITYDDLRGRADEFLGRFHPAAQPPIPIDEIVQCEFNVDVIPVSGFEDFLGVVAGANRSFSKIYVDRGVFDTNLYRYRFSIAHELGHWVLHQDYMKHLRFSTIDEWKEVVSTIDKKQYLRLEYQANCFAGVVLTPPALLRQEFRQATVAVEASGISLTTDPDVAISEIKLRLIEVFKVSMEVIEIRLGYDNLWPN